MRARRPLRVHDRVVGEEGEAALPRGRERLQVADAGPHVAQVPLPSGRPWSGSDAQTMQDSPRLNDRYVRLQVPVEAQHSLAQALRLRYHSV